MDLDKVRCPFLYVYGIMSLDIIPRRSAHRKPCDSMCEAHGIIFNDRYIKEVL